MTHGGYVRARKPSAQFREVVERLQRAARMAPFTRYPHCNLPLTEVGKDAVRQRLPEAVGRTHARLTACESCRRIYREGNHWLRMRELLERVARRANATQRAPG